MYCPWPCPAIDYAHPTSSPTDAHPSEPFGSVVAPALNTNTGYSVIRYIGWKIKWKRSSGSGGCKIELIGEWGSTGNYFLEETIIDTATIQIYTSYQNTVGTKTTAMWNH